MQRDAIEFDVQPTTSVAELAAQILARFKPASSPAEPYNRVRVIHRGRVLPDDKSLQQCNLLADDDAAEPTKRTVVLHAALSSLPSARLTAPRASVSAVSNASARRDRPSFTTVLVAADSRPVAATAAVAAAAALVSASSAPASSSSSSSTSAASSLSAVPLPSIVSSSSTSSSSSSAVAASASTALTLPNSGASTSPFGVTPLPAGDDVDLERGEFFDARRRAATDDELVVRRRGAGGGGGGGGAARRHHDDDTSSDEEPEARLVIADDGVVSGAPAQPAAPASALALEAGEADSDDERETGGFDVLRRFGFSAADVAAVRRDFHRVRPASRAAMFRAEEQWLNDESRREDADVQRGLAEDAERASRDGAEHDFVIGLIVGFAFSVLSVAFLTQKFVTRRAQAGITLGIVTNLMMGLSKWFVGFP